MTILQAPAVPFLGAPVVLDPAAVATPYAFYGIPFGPPYQAEDLTVCAGAADAIRELARDMEYGPPFASHFDFDWGGPLFPDDVPIVTDCGNVIGDHADPDAIWDRAIEVGRTLVQAGRVPLVMGGLDAIPPMVVAAFEGIETVNVVHVDAHVDFREEVGGVRRGYSSPIRRIRELGCTGRIVQVGLRAVGSGRPSDVEDARRAGNHLVTAWEVHEHGIGPVLQVLDATPGRWVVTIDCDGMDPTIAPAVGWPEPGGLTYPQIAGIVRALARGGRVAALIATEFQPALDLQRMTARTVTRLFLNVIGLQRGPFPAAGRAG